MDDQDFPVDQRPKRARVGRPPEEILAPIQADVKAIGERSQQRDVLELLVYLGRPKRNESLVDTMKPQTVQLASTYRFSPELALESLFECTESLSAQTPILMSAVASVHKTTSYDLGFKFVEMALLRLQSCLESGDSVRVRLLLRALAGLAALGVIAATDFLALCTAVLVDARKMSPLAGHCVVYCVLSSLPWAVNTPSSPFAGQGLGHTAVRDTEGVQALLSAAASTLDALKVPTAEESAAYAQSPSAARQRESLFGWACPVDGPAAAVTTLGVSPALRALAAPPARALLALLQAALAAGGVEALAVSSIARPQDDLSFCAFMGLKPNGEVVPPPEPTPASALAPAAPSGGEGMDAPPGDDTAMTDAAATSAAEGSAATSVHGQSTVQLGRLKLDAHGHWQVEAQEQAGAGTATVGTAVLPPVLAHSQWYIRHYLTILGPGGLSGTPAVMRALGLDVPGVTPLSLWATREVAADVTALTAPLHQEAAKALLRLPMGRGRDAPPPFNCSPIAVETVLAQMMALPCPPYSAAYYAVLMLDLFRMDAERVEREAKEGSTSAGGAAGLVPVTVALVCKVLWKYLPILDTSLTDTLTTWLAHHLSNTKFTWPWTEWAGALAAAVPASDPHKRFVCDLLVKTFALVGPLHYEKIVSTHFPAAYAASGFIPPMTLEAARSILLEAPVATQPSAAGVEHWTGAAGDVEGAEDSRAPGQRDEQEAAGEGGGMRSDMDADDVAILRRTAPAAEHDEAAAMEGGAKMDNPGTPSLATAAAQGSAVAARVTRREVSSALYKLATSITQLLVQKRTPAEMQEMLSAEEQPAESKLLAFCHALLMYGKATLRNSSILLERYKGLLSDAAAWGFSAADIVDTSVIPSSAPHAMARVGHPHRVEDMRAEVVLAAVEQVWAAEPSVASAVTDLIVSHGIVSAEQVVRFSLEPATTLADHTAEGLGLSQANTDQTLPAHRLAARLLHPKHWSLVHATLSRAADACHMAGVEVSLYTGAKVYDDGPVQNRHWKEWQLEYEDEAAAKEAGLRAQARSLVQGYKAAVLAAVEHGVRAARALQSHLHALHATGGGAPDSPAAVLDQPDCITELLRVSLAHTRRVIRDHAAAVLPSDTDSSGAVSNPSLTHILEITTHLGRTTARPEQGEVGDLGSALVQGAEAFIPSYPTLAPALVRDAMVPAVAEEGQIGQ